MKILLVIAIAFMLNACTTARTIADIRDDDYTQGCVVVEAGMKLGYFNQAGEAGVCKLKCSNALPDGFKYHYKNDRTGCNVGIGIGVDVD